MERNPTGTVPSTPKVPAEVEVAFSMDGTGDLDATAGGYGTQGYAGASNERLEQHVARAGESAITPCGRVQTGSDQRPAGLDRTGDIAVIKRPFSL